MPHNYKASECENHTANILKQLDKLRFDTHATIPGNLCGGARAMSRRLPQGPGMIHDLRHLDFAPRGKTFPVIPSFLVPAPYRN